MQLDVRPFLIPWPILAGTLLWLSAVIYSRQKLSLVGRLFCLLLLETAIWLGAFSVMFATSDVLIASVAGRVGFSVITLLPASVYRFTATALRFAEKRARVITLIQLGGYAFAALVLLTGLIVEPLAHQYPWGFYPRFTFAGGLVFAAFFAATLVLHLTDCWREYRRTADPRRRGRIVELTTGFLIVYIAVLDFRAAFGIDARPFGYIPVAAFIVFSWRAIRRHRFTPVTAASAASDILETMADALLVLDRDGRIRVVNSAVTSTFGYPPSEIMGRSLDYLDLSGSGRSLVDDLQHRLEYGVLRDHQGLFRHKKGHGIDVSISASALHDTSASGGAVVIARDIRERKRDEQEMQIFNERLQQSNRELEDFAHVASHDLQEPLRKIQAFGDRLVSRYGDSIPPEGRDYLQRMQRAAERMQTLINDLLTFSRVTTKAHPFAPCDLSLVVSEVLHDLELSIAEQQGRIDVSPLPVIEADSMQMRQLFQNLIGNALKFRRSDVSPRVEIISREEGSLVVIEVRDNGIGFESKYADRIFTIFERLHGRAAYAGTGIGLAICRKIVERHHGTISADSTPGEGTIFTVRLPATQSRKDSR